MNDPTPQALKAAEGIIDRYPRHLGEYTAGTLGYIIDRETKLPELLEVAQQARELCKVLYIQATPVRFIQTAVDKAEADLNDALGRLDNPKTP